MKALVIALFSISAHAGSVPYTTVKCTVMEKTEFSGTKTTLSESTDYSAKELTDILLGKKQIEKAAMPYPSDKVVGPSATDFQTVPLKLTVSPFGFAKAYYFTLLSENFVEMHAFCIVSQEAGL